jgi:hypothetical protein
VGKEGRREGGKEGRREGGKEGRRDGGKEGRREGGKEGRREGGKEGSTPHQSKPTRGELPSTVHAASRAGRESTQCTTHDGGRVYTGVGGAGSSPHLHHRCVDTHSV